MLLLTLWACTGAPERAGPEPSEGLDTSWIATIVRDPAAFTTTVDAGGREGWAAVHRNDWPAAVASGGVPGRRAEQELAVLHTTLARVHRRALTEFGEVWEARGGVPADSALPLVISAAGRDGADPAVADRWLEAARRSTNPAVVSLAALWADPLATTGAGPLADRARAHAAARADPARAAALRDAGRQPLHREPAASGERLFWDPWLHTTLALTHRARGEGGPLLGLESWLFTATLQGVGPKGTGVVGLDGQLSELGIALPAGADDAEACREVARALDAQLDAWITALAAGAGDEGRALLTDLRLVPGTRARVLVSLGLSAIEAGQPRCALAYGDLALDHESPRAIGPTNPPTLFALLAEANLSTGRTREALDALEVLSSAYPEVAGLDETVGDLSVLVGMSRSGDSREN